MVVNTVNRVIVGLLVAAQVAYTYDLVQEIKNYFMIEDYDLHYFHYL